MSATVKKAARRPKTAPIGAGTRVAATTRTANGRLTKPAATKGGSLRHVAKKRRSNVQAVRQRKPSATEKAADAAARRRVAATLDLEAFAATLPSTARATAKHWATPA